MGYDEGSRYVNDKDNEHTYFGAAVAHNHTNISFMLEDNAFEGFPGRVITYATYSTAGNPTMTSRLISIPLDGATPIMLTTHPYFSLNAFGDPASPDSLDHTVRYYQFDNLKTLPIVSVSSGGTNGVYQNVRWGGFSFAEFEVGGLGFPDPFPFDFPGIIPNTDDDIIAFAANDVQTIQNGGASTDTNYSFQVCGVGYSGGVSYPTGLAVKK
ncbi:MAG: hypothetical protein L6R42_005926 [Xanthoria sp. 1 TBL-2021]|nr:MAG: hypothetical protein L6R42_005926 [Xanthoria sp. 1 TBL-2021]